jgi:4'-phosphopantetheinyl transferase
MTEMTAMTAMSDTTSWLRPPAELALGPDDVHVWRVSLAQSRADIAALAGVLRDDERSRAARFVFDRDRDAFTVARGSLRTLLGRYLGCPPRELELGYRDKGKPYLLTPPGEPVRFNVSHSGEIALIAFARDRELGVDVERSRPMSDLLAVARLSFSPPEHAALCALPERDHQAAFFACWSRKEAFIKATGEGVSQLNDFEVSLLPGEPARIVRIEGEVPAQPRWSMTGLPAIAGYALALVVEGRPYHLRCFDWPP